MVYKKHNTRKHRINKKKHNKTRIHKKHNKKTQNKKHTKHTKHTKTHKMFWPKLKGGSSLAPVPFVPPNGGLPTGASNGRQYYYDYNQYNNVPGIRYTEPRPQGGGGLTMVMPRDVLDLSRIVGSKILTTYNTIMAKPTPISQGQPLAFEQPNLVNDVPLDNYTPDVQNIMQTSYQQAASM